MKGVNYPFNLGTFPVLTSHKGKFTSQILQIQSFACSIDFCYGYGNISSNNSVAVGVVILLVKYEANIIVNVSVQILLEHIGTHSCSSDFKFLMCSR